MPDTLLLPAGNIKSQGVDISTNFMYNAHATTETQVTLLENA
jgi:hypothetical protein